MVLLAPLQTISSEHVYINFKDDLLNLLKSLEIGSYTFNIYCYVKPGSCSSRSNFEVFKLRDYRLIPSTLK